MFGYVNHDASCYMDSVLVALFVPPETAWPDVFFNGTVGVGVGEAAVVAQLRREMEMLQQQHPQPPPLPGTCHAMRGALRTFARGCPSAAAAGLNMQSNSPQSAVDFLQFLVRACGVDTQRVTQFQTSTTLLVRRPSTAAAAAAAGSSSVISRMVREWMSVPTKHKWTRENAHLLTDVGERLALQKDARALLSENMEGDVRRVTPPESTCVFLCQLTATDDDDGGGRGGAPATMINIARELLPHMETIDAECYSGKVGWKIVAVRLLHAPLLVIEVSRNVTVFSQTRAEKKVTAPVSFGAFDSRAGRWVLRVHDKFFRLTAVVCHMGGAGAGGHYVSYVSAPRGWFFYDDTAPRGEMLPVPASFQRLPARYPHPAVEGELFFYAAFSD